MSHSKEREEKICLNCGAHLRGRYCHICGQENTEPKETVWGLVSHFFNDITHFDGKFFSTGKYLLTKPGFLSSEYIKGRRASYLHPIRMYVFTASFFFIIFFSMFNPGEMMKGSKDDAEQLKELTGASNSLKEKLKLPETNDTDLNAAILRSISKIDAHAAILKKSVSAGEKEDSAKLVKTKTLLDSAGIKIKGNPQLAGYIIDSITAGKRKMPRSANIQVGNFKNLDYHSKIAYDSVQKELPLEKRDGWFKRAVINKIIIYKTKYKNDEKEAGTIIMEKFLHTLPQALFVSLPVFAFILMLLYARRKFYYVDHGIFTIHLYCAVFILLLLYFGIDKAEAASGWGWLSLFKALFVLGIFFYLYKAMRNFYSQGRFKTILKFILLNFFFFIVVVILIVVFVMLSVMQFS